MLFKYWVVCLLLFILFIQARASSSLCPPSPTILPKTMKPVIRTGHVRKAATAKCISATARGSWYMTVIAGLSTSAGERYCPFGVCERRPYLCGGIRGIRLFQVFGGRHSPVPFFEQIPEKFPHGEQRNMEHCRAGRSHLLPVVQRLVLLRREDGHAFRNRQQQPLYFYTQNGHIYTQMIDEDFYEFDGKDFLHLFPRSQVNDDNVVALLPDGNDSFLNGHRE